MVFPEIRSWFRKHWPGDSGEPIQLGLKQAGITFDPVSAAWYAKNYPQIFSILSGGLPAWSGEAVNRATALGNPVVFACNGLISETIGYLPASLMQRSGNDKQIAANHPMYNAMKNEPSDEITAQGFRELLTSHCVLEGGGYSKIVRRSGTGTAIELQYLLPEQVVPDREKTGQKRLVYVIKNELGATDKTYTVEKGKPHDIFHLRGLGWDGVRGYSVIEIGRQSIGTTIAAERNVARFWANGGRVPYIIQKAKFKTEQEGKEYAKEWRQKSADPHEVLFLTGDAEYQQTGLSMADAQSNEFRQFAISEICRWFHVSPHLVGDLSRATFSNIEVLALEFVKMTLARWIARWESDFHRCVLTPDEKEAGYFLHHNLNALLRGDFPTRMAGYASALQNGHLNIDEVRDLEDRNPLPDGAGSHYHVQVNMGTLTPSGQIQPAQSQLVRLDQPKEKRVS